MRKHTHILFLCGGLSLLMLAGCSKLGQEPKYSRVKGEPIVFSVSARPDTKTAYAGETATEGGKTYERIDWKPNDVIRIYSDKATDRYATSQKWSDYTVTGATAAGRYSKATITNANGLIWSDAGEYKFWGVYPAPATADPKGDQGEYNCSIPTAQSATVADNMSFAYMTAATSVSVSEDAEAAVNLDFEPAFTAFEFIIETQDDPITLKSFTLTSDSKSLSGDFTVKYNGTTRTFTDANETAKKTITVDLGGQVISPATETAAAKTATFTVLAQPQTFNDLTISFKVTVRNETDVQDRVLQLTKGGAGVEFGALKKHILKGIAMPSDLWKIYYKPDLLDVDKWEEIGTITNVIVE